MAKYNLVLLITLIILFFFVAANIVRSNEEQQYIESMDLVGDYNAYQRKWMNEAWKMSNDKEFMYMLKAENGLLNHDRQATSGEPSFGFCQTHQKYHPEIVNDPRFFTEPLWQLEQCYRLYKGGTRFYAVDRMRNDANFRAQVESSFIFF